MDNFIGKKIAGRYNIKELIGMGGMAKVYKAECETLKRNVAIKVLLENLRDDEETINNFTKEAQAAARLSHNNIVSVFDVGEDNGIHYMVMELVDGVTLKEYITQHGPFDWQEACNFCIQIGAALSEAHSHGVIHRDIKPHNILITKDKILKVTDFGIAKAVGTNTVTMGNNSAIGTVHYISPEQARGGYTDERSDIYSLGVVLYELLTGKVPFNGDTAISVALMHIENPVPNILNDNQALPRAFKLIIEKAMAKEQFARYASVEEFITDIRAVLAGEELDGMPIADLGETRIHGFDDDEFERERQRRARENVEYEEDIPDQDSKKQKKVKTKEEKKADRTATWLAILTMVLILALGIGGFALFNELNSEKEVPDLIGLTAYEAAEKAKNLGFEFEVRDKDNADANKAGIVYDQNPRKGEKLKKGGTIIGYIDHVVKMPNLEGETIEVAKEELKKIGIDDYTIKDDENAESGIVSRQVPEAEELYEIGTTVVLYVGSSERENEDEEEKIRVPELEGYSKNEAKQELEELGFEVGKIKENESKEEEGTVIGLEPASGTKVEKGTKINIIISKGMTKDTPKPEETEKPEESEGTEENSPDQTVKPTETIKPTISEKPDDTDVLQKSEKPDDTKVPQKSEETNKSEKPKDSEEVVDETINAGTSGSAKPETNQKEDEAKEVVAIKEED